MSLLDTINAARPEIEAGVVAIIGATLGAPAAAVASAVVTYVEAMLAAKPGESIQEIANGALASTSMLIGERRAIAIAERLRRGLPLRTGFDPAAPALPVATPVPPKS